MSQYVVDSETGQLRPNGYVNAEGDPFWVAVDPSNRWAYVANQGSNTVSQYRIGTTGVLTPLSPPTVSTGFAPSSVTVHPSGPTVYE